MATFSISATARKAQTAGNGSAGPFSFSFQVNAQAEIDVFVDTTLKTLSTHYTVSVASNGTGTVSFTTGNFPTSSQVITILGDAPLSRTSVYTSGGNITAAALESDFDTNVMVQQQQQEVLERTVKAPVDDAASVDMTLPGKDDRKGTVLGFNATSGNPEAGPTITAVQSLSDVTASINRLGTAAVVEDMGLLSASAVIEDMGLLGTSGNVSAMALLGTSAAVADMAILGTSAIVADMAILGTDDVVADMAILGTSDVVTDMNLLATAAVVEDMGLLGTSANVSAMGHIGTSANVTAMGLLGTSAVVTDMGILGTAAIVEDMSLLGTSANVTSMGLLGTSAVVEDMGLLGTAAVVEDMGLLATSAVIEDIGLLATSAVIEDMGLLATSAVIEDMGLLATSAAIEDMGILGTSANVTNMATLGASGVVGNIATVSSNVAGVNAFAARYRVASSDPSSDNDEGDLFYNTSDNTFKFFNGSSYVAVNVSGIGNIVEDTSPQLGGNLDGQDKNITTTGVGTFASLDISGDIDVDGTTNLDAVDIDGAVNMATTLLVTGNVDFNGDLDVDGTTNLDVVDIDGAVDMATTLAVAGNVDFNGDLDVDGTTNLDVVDIDGAVDMASTLTVAGDVTITSGSTLDVFNSGNAATELTALFGADNGGGHGRTNSTVKSTVLGVPHYTNSEEAVGLIVAGSTSSSNFINIGGGASVINAATTVSISTAANQTTTGGTDRLTVNSAGDIDVETGDIFFSTAGKGIVLGATTNTDANTLSEYEIGNWTPSFAGVSNTPTYHGIAGTYTKIGRTCTVQMFIQTNQAPTFTTTSNTFAINGLPFTVAGSGYTGSQGSMNAQSFSFNGSDNNIGLTGVVSPSVNNSEQMQFQVTASGSVRGIVNNVGAAKGFILEVTLTYFTSD